MANLFNAHPKTRRLKKVRQISIQYLIGRFAIIIACGILGTSDIHLN